MLFAITSFRRFPRQSPAGLRHQMLRIFRNAGAKVVIFIHSNKFLDTDYMDFMDFFSFFMKNLPYNPYNPCFFCNFARAN